MIDLRNKFTTGNGKVFAGGFVYVRSGDPTMSISLRRHYRERDGLAVWHPGLVRFGKMDNITALITKRGHLSVRDIGGRVLATLTSKEAISVSVYPGFIANNGYVGITSQESSRVKPATFEDIVKDREERTCAALDKAESGEHPGFVDNSPFTKVTDEFTPHQRVVIVTPMLTHATGEASMIYDLAGNRFASVTHYPLRASKWDPEHEWARYSRSDSHVTSAA